MAFDGPIQLEAQTVIALSEAAGALAPGPWSAQLLRAAYPAASHPEILALPLGQRDALVAAVRRVHWGDTYRCEPECTACATKMELEFRGTDLGFDGGVPELPLAGQGFQTVDIDGACVRLRPVTLGDVLSLSAGASAQVSEQVLADHVLQSDHPIALERLAQALEDLDPLADLWISCRCPECGAGQSLAFDPVAFVAREVRQMAQQLMADVVALARAFHWSETDILALPATRRAYYVSMARA